jgi:hypothetical protein
MASLHGSYREVEETAAAARLIGTAAEQWGITRCRWLLDRPVGNSARLRGLLLEIAAASQWSWQVDLEYSPDRILTSTTETVASSDSVILDRCSAWCNLAAVVITSHVPQAHILNLRDPIPS